MGNVQKHNICINVPSSQTFRRFLVSKNGSMVELFVVTVVQDGNYQIFLTNFQRAIH
jgi:hypothetical protein